MKPKSLSGWRLQCAAIVAVLLGFCPALRAEWGSVRANNRNPLQRAEAQHREVERRVHERRHEDIEAERHRAFYWSGFHAGMTMGVLPAGFVQVSAGATGYYYYDGIYFQATASMPFGYMVVAPPIGCVIPQLPSGAEPVADGDTTYYYAGGAFYVQQANGFAVMPAPLGVTVSTLPLGAVPSVSNGTLYYLANYVYYAPVMQGGVTVYLTAHP